MTGKIPGISSPEDLDYITENVLGLDSTKYFPIIFDTAPTSLGLTSKKNASDYKKISSSAISKANIIGDWDTWQNSFS